MALPMSELQIAKQWAEADQMTSMAAQWSHYTPVMSPIAQEQVGQYMHQVGPSQNSVGYVGGLGLCPPQVDNNQMSLQPVPCCNSSINMVNALDCYSSWQVLMQIVMNSIQDFNSTNWEATILWLDHVEGVTRKMGFIPLELGMNKLKGMALCDIKDASKEGTPSYFWFHQLLIEHYSNIPYVSDALNVYAYLMQGENESIAQYLTRAKVLLKCIQHNSKMSDIPGIGYDKLYLVQGLHSPHVHQRVASK